VESKLRCINFRRVSDHRSAVRPAFRVTRISDYWLRKTMGVIVKSLRTPHCGRENFECHWEHLGVAATTRGALMTTQGALTTNLEAQTTTLGAPAISLGAPRITAEQPGKINIFVRNAADAPGYYYGFTFCTSNDSCVNKADTCDKLITMFIWKTTT
jgi:hypothetical protein